MAPGRRPSCLRQSPAPEKKGRFFALCKWMTIYVPQASVTRLWLLQTVQNLRGVQENQASWKSASTLSLVYMAMAKLCADEQ